MFISVVLCEKILILCFTFSQLEPKPKGAMAGGRSARGSSPSFKVQLSVSDLEKVNTPPFVLQNVTECPGLGCLHRPRAAQGAQRGEAAGQDGPAPHQEREEGGHVQPAAHPDQEAGQPPGPRQERDGLTPEEPRRLRTERR